MSSLSLKTVAVHKSVTSLKMEKNLRKGGLVYRVPCRSLNINTVTYFNLFMCPFKQRDMSVMTREPISFFNFDLLHTVRSS